MVDVERLKKAIDESGIRKGFICDKLGITRQGFYKKETGASDFTSSEIVAMKELLRLTNRQVAEIFLVKK